MPLDSEIVLQLLLKDRDKLLGFIRSIVRDEHVAARYPRAEVLAYSVGSAALLFWWLPLAALGTFFNWIPYRLVGIAAGRARSRDLPATLKLFGGPDRLVKIYDTKDGSLDHKIKKHSGGRREKHH